MCIPPEHFLRRWMGKAPHGSTRNAHPNGSEDNRRDAQVLHEFWPDCSQHSESQAGCEAEDGCDPIQSTDDWSALPGGLLTEHAVGREGRIEAEDGHQRKK